MPNKDEHQDVAKILGYIYGGLKRLKIQGEQIQRGERLEYDILEIIADAFITSKLFSLGAILPDILEPATDPNHRKFFHSVAMALGITYDQLRQERTNYNSNDAFWNYIKDRVGLGYLIHLLMDAQTPKGLPWV